MFTGHAAMCSSSRTAAPCVMAALLLCLALTSGPLHQVQALELNTPPRIALPSEMVSTFEGEAVEIGTGSLFRRPCSRCAAGVLVPTAKTDRCGVKFCTGLELSDAEVQRDYGMVTVNIVSQGGLVMLQDTAGAFFETGGGDSYLSEIKFLAALRIANVAVQSMIFSPTQNFVGQASVTLTLDDQGWSGSGGNLETVATLTVNVSPTPVPKINVAPVISNPGAQYGLQDTALSIAGIQIIDPDFDTGGGLLLVSLAVSTSGQLTLSSDSSLFYVGGTSATGSLIQFEAPIDAANAALTSLVFEPEDGWVGQATFSVNVSDQGHSGEGGVLRDSVTTQVYIASSESAHHLNTAPQISIDPWQPLQFDDNCSVGLAGVVVDDADIDKTFDGIFLVNVSVGDGAVDVPQRGNHPGVAVAGSSLSWVQFVSSSESVNEYLMALTFTGNSIGCTNGTVVRVQVNDQGFTGSGGAMSTEAEILVARAINGRPESNATFVAGSDSEESAPSDVAVFPSVNVSGPLNVTVVAGQTAPVQGVQLSISRTDTTTLLVVHISVDSNNSDVLQKFAVWTSSLYGTRVVEGGRSATDATAMLQLEGTALSLSTALADLMISSASVDETDTPLALLLSVALSASPDALLSTHRIEIIVSATAELAIAAVARVDNLHTTETGPFQLPSVALTIPSESTDTDLYLSATVATSLGFLDVGFDSYFLSKTSLQNSSDSGTTVLLRGSPSVVEIALNSIVLYPFLNSQCETASTFGEVIYDVLDPSSGNSVRLELTVKIDAVNDAPTLAVPKSLVLFEDSSVLLDGVRVSDPDCGNSTTLAVNVSVSGPSTVGMLTFGKGAVLDGVRLLAGSFDDTSNVIGLQGTVQHLNIVLGQLHFLPPRDWSGTAEIAVVVNDLGNFAPNDVNTHEVVAVIPVTVEAVNDAPSLTPSARQLVLTSTDRVLVPPVILADVELASSDVCSLSVACVKGALFIPETVSGLSFSVGSAGVDSSLLSFTGAFETLQALLMNSLFFVPHLNEESLSRNSPDQIDFLFNDRGTSGSGGPLSGSATIRVNTLIDPTMTMSFVTLVQTMEVLQGTDIFIDEVVSVTGCQSSINDNSAFQLVTVRMTASSGTLQLSTKSSTIAIDDQSANSSVVQVTAHCSVVNRLLEDVYFSAPSLVPSDNAVTLYFEATSHQNDTIVASTKLSIISDDSAPSLQLLSGGASFSIQEDVSVDLRTVVNISAASTHGDSVVVLAFGGNVGSLRVDSTAALGADDLFEFVYQDSDEVVVRCTVASWQNFAAGILSFTTPQDWNSAAGDFAVLSLVLSDDSGRQLDSRELTVFVAPVHDTPQLTGPARASVVAGEASVLPGIALDDADVAMSPSALFSVNASATGSGILWIPGAFGVELVAGGRTQDDASGTIALRGTIANLNAALATLTYFQAAHEGNNEEAVVLTALDADLSFEAGTTSHATFLLEVAVLQSPVALALIPTTTLVSSTFGNPTLLDFFTLAYSGDEVLQMELCVNGGMLEFTRATDVQIGHYNGSGTSCVVLAGLSLDLRETLRAGTFACEEDGAPFVSTNPLMLSVNVDEASSFTSSYQTQVFFLCSPPSGHVDLISNARDATIISGNPFVDSGLNLTVSGTTNDIVVQVALHVDSGVLGLEFVEGLTFVNNEVGLLSPPAVGVEGPEIMFLSNLELAVEALASLYYVIGAANTSSSTLLVANLSAPLDVNTAIVSVGVSSVDVILHAQTTSMPGFAAKVLVADVAVSSNPANPNDYSPLPQMLEIAATNPTDVARVFLRLSAVHGELEILDSQAVLLQSEAKSSTVQFVSDTTLINSAVAEGNIVYYPAFGFTGRDMIQVHMSSNEGTQILARSINVNVSATSSKLIELRIPAVLTVDEDTPLHFGKNISLALAGVPIHELTASNAKIVSTLVLASVAVQDNGSVKCASPLANVVEVQNDGKLFEVSGSALAVEAVLSRLVFTPSSNFNGEVVVDFGLTLIADNDDQTLIERSLVVAVNPVDDPPSIAFGACSGIMAIEDELTAVGPVDISDVDTSGMVLVALSARKGSLSLSSNPAATASVKFLSGDDTNDTSLEIQGLLEDVRTVLQNITYQGAADFNGMWTTESQIGRSAKAAADLELLQASVTDLTSGASAETECQLSVQWINDVPSLNTPSTINTIVGTPGVSLRDISTTDVDVTEIYNGQLMLELSVDQGTLQVETTTLKPSLHTFMFSFLSGNGTSGHPMILSGSSTALNLLLPYVRYVPAAGFSGDDALDITATDGDGGTVVKTVPIYVAPSTFLNFDTDSLAISIETLEDTPVTLALQLSAESVTYYDTVPLQLSFEVAHGTVEVNMDATAAVVVNWSTPTMVSEATDVESMLLLRGTASDLNQALDAGAVVFRPAADFNSLQGAVDFVEVRAWSSQVDYTPLQLSIVVTAVNDLPVLVKWNFVDEVTDRLVSVFEDTEIVLPVVEIRDVDISENSTGLIAVELAAKYGSVRLPSCRGIHFLADGGSSCNGFSPSLLFQGGLLQVNAALSQLHYVSATNWNSGDGVADATIAEVQRISASFTEFVSIFSVTTQCLNCVLDSGNFSLLVTVGNASYETEYLAWNASASLVVNESTTSVQSALSALPPLQNATIVVARNPHGRNGGFVWEVQIFDVFEDIDVSVAQAHLADSTSLDPSQDAETMEISFATRGGRLDGSFQVMFGDEETSPLPFDCSADSMRLGLEALNGIGSVDVSRTDSGGIHEHRYDWDVTFLPGPGSPSHLGDVEELLVAQIDTLNGATAQVSVQTILNGSAPKEVISIVVDDGGNTGASGNSTSRLSSSDVSFLVFPSNDQPVISAVDAIIHSDEDHPVQLRFSLVDLDAAKNSLYFVTIETSAGTVSVSGDVVAQMLRGYNSSERVCNFTFAYQHASDVLSNLFVEPPQDFNGVVSILASVHEVEYTNGAIESMSDQSVSEVAVIVAAINDAPTVAAPQSITTTLNLPVLIDRFQIGDVDNDADAGANLFSVSLSSGRGGGGLIFLFADKLPVVISSPNNSTSSIVVEGYLAALNGALGYLQYIPAAQWAGGDNVSLTVTDSRGLVAEASTAVTVLNVESVFTFDFPHGHLHSLVEDSQMTIEGARLVDTTGSVSEETDGTGTISAYTLKLECSCGELTFATSSADIGVIVSPTTASGSLAQVNHALSLLLFHPIKDWNGICEATVTAYSGSSSDEPQFVAADIVQFFVEAVEDAIIFDVGLSSDRFLQSIEPFALFASNFSLWSSDVSDVSSIGSLYHVTVVAANGSVSLATELTKGLHALMSDRASIQFDCVWEHCANAIHDIVYAPMVEGMSNSGVDQVTVMISSQSAIIPPVQQTLSVFIDLPAALTGLIAPTAFATKEDTASELPPLTILGVDGSQLVLVALTVSNGRMQYTGAVGDEVDWLDQVPVANDGTNTLRFQSTLLKANEVLGRILYVPARHFFGADSLKVVVDGDGEADGSVVMLEATINIWISPIADAPLLVLVTEHLADGSVNLETVSSAANFLLPAMELSDADEAGNVETLVNVVLEIDDGNAFLMLTFVPGVAVTSNITSEGDGARAVFTGTVKNIGSMLRSQSVAISCTDCFNTSTSVTAVAQEMPFQPNGEDENAPLETTLEFSATFGPLLPQPVSLSRSFDGHYLKIQEDQAVVLGSIVSIETGSIGVSQPLLVFQLTLRAAHIMFESGSINPGAEVTWQVESSPENKTLQLKGTSSELARALNGLVGMPDPNYFGNDALYISLSAQADVSANASASLVIDVIVAPAVDDLVLNPLMSEYSTLFTPHALETIVLPQFAALKDVDAANRMYSVSVKASSGSVTVEGTAGTGLHYLSSDDMNVSFLASLQFTNEALSHLVHTPSFEFSTGEVLDFVIVSVVDVASGRSATAELKLTISMVQVLSLFAPSVMSGVEDTTVLLTDVVVSGDDANALLLLSLNVSDISSGTFVNAAALTPVSNVVFESAQSGSAALVRGRDIDLQSALSGVSHSISFVPADNWCGVTTMILSLSKMGAAQESNATVVAVVTLDVLCENDAPQVLLDGESPASILIDIEEDTVTFLPAQVRDADFQHARARSHLDFAINVTVSVTVGAGHVYIADATNPSIVSMFAPGVLMQGGYEDSALWLFGDIDRVNSAMENLVFAPAADFYGNAEVTIEAMDQYWSSSVATISISVSSVSDAPSIVLPSFSVLEGERLALLRADGMVVSDIDANAKMDMYVLELAVYNGTLDVGETENRCQFFEETTSPSSRIVIRCTLFELNQVISTVLYSGNNDYFGRDTLDIACTEEASGLVVTDSVFIEVQAVNSAPSVTVSHLSSSSLAQGEIGSLSAGVADEDAGDGCLLINVSASYSAQLSVQSITTHVNLPDASLHKVQKVSVRARGNRSIFNASQTTFALGFDTSVAGEAGMVWSRDISFHAVDLSDKEIPGAGPGKGLGESLEAILNDLADVLPYPDVTFEVHNDQFFPSASGIAWDITFQNFPSSAPFLSVRYNSTQSVDNDTVAVDSATVVQAPSLEGAFDVTFAASEAVSIPFDSTGDDLRDHLQALPTIGKVRVSKEYHGLNGGATWLVTFLDPAGSLPLLDVDKGSLSCSGEGANVAECAGVSSSIEIEGVGVPHVVELKSNVAHSNEVQVITMFDGANGTSGWFEGSFELSLDLSAFGGEVATTRVHCTAVAMIDDELLNGGNGLGPGESMQSKITSMENIDLDVEVSRTSVGVQGELSWSITFLNAPYYLPQLSVASVDLYGVTNPAVDVFTTMSTFDISSYSECTDPTKCTCAQEYLLQSIGGLVEFECQQACSDDDLCRFVYFHQPVDGGYPVETGCDLYKSCDLTRVPQNPVGVTYVKSDGNRVEGWLSLGVEGASTTPLRIRADATEEEMQDAIEMLLVEAGIVSASISDEFVVVSRSRESLVGGYAWTVAHSHFSNFKYTTDATGLLTVGSSFTATPLLEDTNYLQFRFRHAGGMVNAATSSSTTLSEWSSLKSTTGTLRSLNVALSSLEFLAPADWHGTAEITLTVSDQGNTGAGSVGVDYSIIQVQILPQHKPPKILFDKMQFSSLLVGSAGTQQSVYAIDILEDVALRLKGVQIEDSDIVMGGGTLMLTLSSIYGSFYEDGSLEGLAGIEMIGTIADFDEVLPRISYQPPSNWNGDDVVNVTVSTGQDSTMVDSWEVFLVRVASVNDPPYLSCPTILATFEDTGLDFAIGIEDADLTLKSHLWLEASIKTLYGTVTFSESVAGLLNITSSAAGENGHGYSLLEVRGSLDDLQHALAHMRFTPMTDWHGEDQVRIDVSDLGNIGFGNEEISTCLTSVIVESVNDAPYFELPKLMDTPGALSVNEDDALVVEGISILDPDTVAPVQRYESFSIRSFAEHSNEVQVITMFDGANGTSGWFEGSFELSLDLSAFGGEVATTRVHCTAVAMIDDELLNGGNGLGPGESMQSKITSMENIDLDVEVSRTSVGVQGELSWSITFLNAPYYLPQLSVASVDLYGVTNPAVDVFTTMSTFDISSYSECTDPTKCTCAQEYLLQSIGGLVEFECQQACSDDDLCRFVYFHQPVDGGYPVETGCDLYKSCDLTRVPQNPVGVTYVKSDGNRVEGHMRVSLSPEGLDVVVRSDATVEEMREAFSYLLSTAFDSESAASLPFSVERIGPDLEGGFEWIVEYGDGFALADLSVPLVIASADFTDPQSGVQVAKVDAITNELQVLVHVAVDFGTFSLARQDGIDWILGNGLQDKNMIFSGTLVNVNAALADAIYTPQLNWNSRFNGVDVVTFTCTDEKNFTAEAKVLVRVAPINDAPVISVPGENLDAVETTGDDLSRVLLSVDTLYLTEDIPSSVSGIYVRDVDAAESGEPIDVTLSCSHGLLSVSRPHLAHSFSEGSGTADKRMTFRASVSNANELLSSVTYVGEVDYYGVDNIVVSANDNGVFSANDSITSTALFDTVVVPVSIVAVNDPPYLLLPHELLQTIEDTSLILPAVDIGDVDSEYLRVLIQVANGNISIVETANLTFHPTSGGDSAVRVVGEAEAYIEFIASPAAALHALSALVYYPPANWNTLFRIPDVVTISVSDTDEITTGDGSYTVRDFVDVVVLPVNDAPSFDMSGAHYAYVYGGVETITSIDTIEIQEDNGMVLQDLRIRDIDADEAFGSTLELTLHCSHCILQLGEVTGLHFKYAGKQPGTSTVVAEGSLTALNDALRSVHYSPNLNFHGEDEILLQISDNGNTGPAHAGLYVTPFVGASEIQCFSIFRNQSSSPKDEGGAANFWAQARLAGGFENSTLTLTAGTLGSIDVDSHASVLNMASALRELFQTTYQELQAGRLMCDYDTVLLDSDWSDTDSGSVPGSSPCSSSRVPLYVTESVSTISIERCIHFSPMFGNVAQVFVTMASGARSTAWTKQDGAFPTTGALYAAELVPIEVKARNDAPTIIVPSGTLAVQEDQSKSFSVQVFDVDTDTDGTEAQYRVALSVSHGLLKITADEDDLAIGAAEDGTSLNISTRTTDYHQTDTSNMWADFVVVEGTLHVVNLALQDIVYQPERNWNSDSSSGSGSSNSFDVIGIRVDDLSHAGATGDDIPRNMSATAEVKFQLVSGVNDPPTITVPGMHRINVNCTTVDEASRLEECEALVAVDAVLGEEDTILIIDGVSIDDPDVHETYGGAVELALQVSHGFLSLGREGLYFLEGNSLSSEAVRFRCSLPRCNDALALLRYTPSVDWFGMDQLVITASDQGFTGQGGAMFDNVTLPIQILPVNDPPSCTVPDVNFNVEEDMNVALLGISIDDVDGLDGDVEISVVLTVDHGALSLPPLMEEHLEFTRGDFSTGSVQPGGLSWRRFSKEVSFSGTLARVRDALAALEYVPDLNFNSDVNGTDKVSMLFADATGADIRCSVFVDVAAVNDAPFLSAPQSQRSSSVVASDGMDFVVEAVNDFAVDENAQVLIEGVSLRDVDVSGPQNLDVTISCDFGLVSIASAAIPQLLFSHGTGVNDTYMLFTGHLDVINQAIGALVYVAASEFGDSDSIVITVTDNGFSGFGSALTDTLILPVSVYEENDAPTILVPLHQDNSTLQHIGEEDTLLLAQDILYAPSSRTKLTRLTTGYELWRSEAFRPTEDFDSRTWRTSLVRDIHIGSLASHPKYFQIYNRNGSSSDGSSTVGDILYFQADDGVGGAEFWQSDGTEEGTVLVEDLYPGEKGSSPSEFTVFQDRLFFSADGVDNKWILTTDSCHGMRQSSQDPDVVFVIAADNMWQPEKNYECPIGYYWASTAEGKTRFTVPESANDAGAEYSYFDQCGWKGYEHAGAIRRKFRFSDSHIFGSTKEAGTTDGHVIKVADFSVEEFAGVVCLRGDGASCDRLYQTDNPLHAGQGGSCFHRAGKELWSSDGTVKGTFRVVDIERGFASSNPTFLTPLVPVNGTNADAKIMLFRATTREYGSELWRTDGTIAGTFIVADIHVGAPSSSPAHLTVLNGLVIFAADDGWRGNELWLSDGTRSASGRTTHVVKDINPGATGSSPEHFVIVRSVDMPNLSPLVQEYAFFSATTDTTGAELWVTDGTLSGTQLVKDIQPGAAGSRPAYLVYHNSLVFFQADGGVHGPELWVSDGTSAGTRLLADIAPGSAGSRPSFLTLFSPAQADRPQLRPSDSGIFFVANSGISSTSCQQSLRCRNSFELWVTDGTAHGTARAFEHSFKDFDLDPRSFENQRSTAMVSYDGALIMSFNGLVDEVVSYDSVARDPRQQSIAIIDVDADASTQIEVHMYSTKGELSLSLSNSGEDVELVFSEGDGMHDQSMTFVGTEDAINDALTAVLYHALPDQTGWDEVVIETSERGATSKSSISILIDPVNDPPAIAAPSSLVAYPDVELSIFGTTVEDVDVDDTYAGKNGSLTMRVDLEQGHITLNSLLGLTFTQGDGVFDKQLEFTGTKLNLNKAVFNLKYKCWTGDIATGCELGKDTIKLSVSDNGYAGSGGAQSAVTVIDISVQEDTTIDVSTYL